MTAGVNGTPTSGDTLSTAVRLVLERGPAARLFVLRGGTPIVDEGIGCASDALFWLFSAGKPFIAVLVHRLAELGIVELDAPVARYWPGFAQRGKDAVTVRQVLQHRSGMAVATTTIGDALAMADWQRSVRHIERARLRWPNGSVPAYQYLAFGFILGELVLRATGEPIAHVLKREVLDPLGLHDTYLGLPDDQLKRCVPIRGASTPGRIVQFDLNRPAIRRAVIPAAGVSTTADDLSRLYLMLLGGGELDGVRVLSQASIADMLRPTSDGEIDRHAKTPIRWSQGFQLGGGGRGSGYISSLGELSSRLAFGHNGSNCCVAWADPTRDLVLVHLTNRLGAGRSAIAHFAAVADAVIAWCDEQDAVPHAGIAD